MMKTEPVPLFSGLMYGEEIKWATNFIIISGGNSLEVLYKEPRQQETPTVEIKFVSIIGRFQKASRFGGIKITKSLLLTMISGVVGKIKNNLTKE
jgi:hypothetical protein